MRNFGGQLLTIKATGEIIITKAYHSSNQVIGIFFLITINCLKELCRTLSYQTVYISQRDISPRDFVYRTCALVKTKS